MKIIDISPEISDKIAVFPGDQKFENPVFMDFSKGHHLKLSSVKTTVHLGAHADAPNHYENGASGISERSLEYYFGPCQVLKVRSPRGERVKVEHLVSREIITPRVLLRTDSFPDPNTWNSDFNSLSVELIEFFNEKKVRLVGIDTPSIDPETSKDLPAHKRIADFDMAVLEGIVLNHVEDGEYFLSALPLKIKDCDASPVRAVLIDSLEFPL